MLFYLGVLFIIVVVCGRYQEKGVFQSENLELRFAFFLLAFISAARFDVGFDYVNYYNSMFEPDNYELLPKIAAYIAKFFNCKQLFFILMAIPTYYLAYKTIDNFSVSKYESLIIYVALIYLDTLGYVRQMLAVSIVFYGYRYIIERKFLKYSMICVIAFFAHKSALLGFVVYFLYNYMNINMTILLSLIALVLKDFILSKLASTGFYGGYIEVLDKYSGGSKTALVILALFILVFFFCIFYEEKKENNGDLNVFLVGAMAPLFLGPHFGKRLSFYFIIFLCISWPKIFEKFNIKIKALFLCLFYVYFILYIYITTISNKSAYIPYQFFFFVDQIKFRQG